MELTFCKRNHVYDSDKYEECPHCAQEKELCTDYEGKCGNCHSSLGQEDAYCRICGTKRGEGAFAPYSNIMQCIYGPMPQERNHKCLKCGYSWKNCVMVDRDKYCPKCGDKVVRC